MNWTDEVKQLIEQYSRGYAWLSLHDKIKDDNYDKVNTRLMQIEEKLRSAGLTPEQIQSVIDKINLLLTKPTGEMSRRELEFICQVIFGKESSVLERPVDADLVIKALYELHRGFIPAKDVADVLHLPMEHVRNILQQLANLGEVSQYKPRHDLWSMNIGQRENWAERQGLIKNNVDKNDNG